MKRHGKRIQLDDGGDEHRYQLLAEIGQGPGSDNRSVEQLARVIRAKHRQYGEVKLDQQTFQSFISNFESNAYGQDLFIDVAHRPEDGAAGQIKRLFTEGDALLAEIEWTPRGKKAIKEEGFRYFSIDFHDDYEDPETGANHGPTLFGAALVTRPFIKRMKPVQGRMHFSEERRLWVPGYLSVSKGGDMKEYLKKLREALIKYGLGEGVVKQLLEAFETQAKELGEDEAALKAAFGVYDKMGKALGEEIGDREITIKLEDLPNAGGAGGGGGGAQLSEEDIDKRLQKMLDEREEKARKAKEAADRKLSEVKASFEKQLDDAEGLSDETRESLKKDWNPMLSGDMSEDQVNKLAEKVIKAGHEIERSRKLTEMGYELPGGAGQYIQMGDEPVGKRLGADLRKRLGDTAAAESDLKLPEEEKCSKFTQKVLAAFDHRNAKRLDQESKVLAGDGSTNIGDGDFPVAAQRQVILETLSDLRFLDLVRADVDPQATSTTEIPYEERNTSQVRNGGRVYEGKPIPAAGVVQKMDIAYIEPRKISLLMSNEMMHFSRASRIDWDAWARSIASNSRLLRELVTADIANQYLRAADSYLASEVTDEDLEPQFDGDTSEMKLAQFPLVRPHQQRDLQGTTVGSAENPISITLDGSAVEEYDGTGDQSAGTYYKVTSYNLGKIQFVDEAGDPVTPADTTTCTITYWYATNVVKFDLDNGSTEYEKHLNGLLHRIGRRKALLADERFVRPNFLISSHTLHQTVSEAEQFTAHGTRSGTGANAEGMVDQVKGVPAWATNEPGIDLGDERLLLGERGTMGYTVAKAFMVGSPFEAVDATTGRPTGQKMAYGEEYSAMKVPTAIRNRLTSVLAYSASGR